MRISHGDNFVSRLRKYIRPCLAQMCTVLAETMTSSRARTHAHTTETVSGACTSCTSASVAPVAPVAPSVNMCKHLRARVCVCARRRVQKAPLYNKIGITFKTFKL